MENVSNPWDVWGGGKERKDMKKRKEKRRDKERRERGEMRGGGVSYLLTLKVMLAVGVWPSCQQIRLPGLFPAEMESPPPHPAAIWWLEVVNSPPPPAPIVYQSVESVIRKWRSLNRVIYVWAALDLTRLILNLSDVGLLLHVLYVLYSRGRLSLADYGTPQSLIYIKWLQSVFLLGFWLLENN